MRAETQVPLTPAEHRELARELRKSRLRLRELCNMVMTVYGPDHGAAEAFQALADSMDRLCAEMQRQAIADCPGVSIDGLYL
jgi:hypothetical protein